MRGLLVIALTLVASVGMAQTKTKTDTVHGTAFNSKETPSLILSTDTSLHILNTYTNFADWNYSYMSETVYPDTVHCLFHEYSTEILLDKWTAGYIVLIDGKIKSGHISWSPDFAPMALGFFDNVFLYDDKHPIKNKVFQVIIN